MFNRVELEQNFDDLGDSFAVLEGEEVIEGVGDEEHAVADEVLEVEEKLKEAVEVELWL
jgi:hypothetical protein